MSPGSDDTRFEEQVRALLCHQYRISGRIDRLGGENRNYRVTTDGGDRYVLKVAVEEHGGQDFDMEHRAVEHVAASGLDLRVPQTVMTEDGALFAMVGAPEGNQLRARLLRWVSGVPWCELDGQDDQLLTNLGGKLAELALVLANFRHPAMHRTHRWDLSRAGQHRAKTVLVRKVARRAMLDRMFHLWAAGAATKLDALPGSFIHGDANDENLLVEGNAVTGLLDFGDSLYNPTVCELAITLAYIMLDRDNPLGEAMKVVAGYQRVRPLTEGELSALFPLVCGRLATTVSVAAERRIADPGHPTWFVTEDRAWALIEYLCDRDLETLGADLHCSLWGTRANP